MHIILAIILIAVLLFAWDAKGSAWMLKALAWTAGSIAGITALLVFIALMPKH